MLCSGIVRVFVRHTAMKERSARRRRRLLEEGEGIRDFGKTLIVGAGGAGLRLMGEIRTEAFFEKCDPVCFVDDNEAKLASLFRVYQLRAPARTYRLFVKNIT